MGYIGLFIVLLSVLYLCFKTVYLKRLKKERYEKLSEVRYFAKKYKLNKQDLYNKEFYKDIAFINSLVISFTGTIVMYLDILKSSYLLDIVVGFVLLFLVLYSLYEIYGSYLKRKKEKENGNKHKKDRK